MIITEFNQYLNVNFLNWFGKSKVVDDKGKPLEVYHGTTASKDIEVFDTGTDGVGIYFTDCLDVASDYGHQIIKAYLKIDNPIIIDAEGRDWFYFEGQDNIISNTIDSAIKNKNDGVIVKNINDPHDPNDTFDEDGVDYYNPSTIYIVFKQYQIKSINNKGTWNSDSNNINENFNI